MSTTTSRKLAHAATTVFACMFVAATNAGIAIAAAGGAVSLPVLLIAATLSPLVGAATTLLYPLMTSRVTPENQT